MMFYKFISDPFSTSQSVFDNGRQCRAGRQKVGCNGIWGLQNHQPPILRREGLSTPRMAVSICISGQLFHECCKSGAFYSPGHSLAFLHLSRKSQVRLGGATWNPPDFLTAHKSPNSFTLTGLGTSQPGMFLHSTLP